MRRACLGLILVALAACGRNEAGVPGTASPQPLVDSARLETTLSGYVDRGELVGVSALVFEDGDRKSVV